MSIKDIYYFFEDHYYSLLDKLDSKIPIYKLVDKIDGVMPSFVLFFSIFLIFIFLLLFTVFVPSSFLFNVKVIDSVSNSPIENAILYVDWDLDFYEARTSESGLVSFSNSFSSFPAFVSVKADGFSEFEGNLDFDISDETVIKLEPIVSFSSFEYVVRIWDSSSKNLILSPSTKVSFACGDGTNRKSLFDTDADGKISFIAPCDDAVATSIESRNYSSKSNVSLVSTSINDVYLSKSAVVKGSLIVNVSDGESIIDGALVKVFKDNILISQNLSSGGRASFSLSPDDYEIYVEKVSFSDFSSVVSIIENETETLNVVLNKSGVSSKNFILKCVDSVSKQPIENVRVIFYKNNKILDVEQRSDSSGIVDINVSDLTGVYVAVLRHENYVLKIVDELSIKSVSDSAQIIELVRISEDGSNFGNVVAHISDEFSLEAVEGAKVVLFSSIFPEMPLMPYLLSNEDGNVLFSNLPDGNYFVSASLDSKFNKSVSKNLVSGKTIFLNVVLRLGKGKVVANSFSYNNSALSSLSDVDVLFFNSSSESIDSGKTNSSGKLVSSLFDEGNLVFARGSKSNFFDGVSSSVEVSSFSNRDLKVILHPFDQSIVSKGIDIKFNGVFDSSGNRAIVFEPGKSYYFDFFLFLPIDSDYDADLLFNSLNQNLVLDNVFNAPYSPVVSFGSCSNYESFSIPPSCKNTSDSSFPSSLFSWNSVSGNSVLNFRFLGTIDDAVNAGEIISLDFSGRANVDDAVFDFNVSKLSWIVGQALCEPGFDGCPFFYWYFDILENGTKSRLDNFSAQNFYPLDIEQDYSLELNLINLSDNSFDSDLLVSSDEEIISFSDLSSTSDNNKFVSSISLSPKMLFSDSINFSTTNSSNSSVVRFFVDLDSFVDGSVKDLFFSVEFNRDLIVQDLPSFLIPDFPGQVVSGFVLDSVSKSSIDNALVKLVVDDEELYSTFSDESGFFSFYLEQGYSVDSVLEIIVVKEKYNVFSYSIPITFGNFVDWRYNCIEISPSRIELNKNDDFSFDVLINCDEDVELDFFSDLDIDFEKSVKSKSSNFSVNGSAVFKDGSVFQGIYPIFIKARFVSFPSYVSAIVAKVLVFDPESCFSLDKFEFDLVDGFDSGILVNSCLSNYSDGFSPELSLDSFKVILSKNGFDLENKINFEWFVNVKGTSFSSSADSEISYRILTRDFPFENSFFSEANSPTIKSLNLGSSLKIKNIGLGYYVLSDSVDEDLVFLTSDVSFDSSSEVISNPCSGSPISCGSWSKKIVQSGESMSPFNVADPYPFTIYYLDLGSVDIDSVSSISSSYASSIDDSIPHIGFWRISYEDSIESFVSHNNSDTVDVSVSGGNAFIYPIKGIKFFVGDNSILSSALGNLGDFYLDSSASVYSSNPLVKLWIEGDKIFAEYIGDSSNSYDGSTSFGLDNYGLDNVEYNLITVGDYINN